MCYSQWYHTDWYTYYYNNFMYNYLKCAHFVRFGSPRNSISFHRWRIFYSGACQMLWNARTLVLLDILQSKRTKGSKISNETYNIRFSSSFSIKICVYYIPYVSQAECRLRIPSWKLACCVWCAIWSLRLPVSTW